MADRSLHLVRPTLARVAALSLATSVLGGCLSRNAADMTGSIGRSGAYASDSDPRGDAEALGRRYEANPGDAAAAFAYARVLRARGQTAQATAVLQQATLRSPGDLTILAEYGKVLAASGRPKEASDVLARAHRPDRPDWRLLSVQGTVADQLGEFDAAQRYYAAALRIAPGEPSIMSNQGLSFALAKRLDEAERILVDAARHPRADARVRQNLALVLGLKGRFPEAEEVLKRDMPPAEAAKTAAGLRGMVRQPNSWKALGQGGAQPADPARQAAL